ncbi:MAG: right-handed parallel beta-helix repeat-containing protein [bacterium]
MYNRLFLSLLFCFLYFQLHAQSYIDQKIIEKHLYVNNQHPNASDMNTGSNPEYPLSTLSKALETTKNIPSRITIFPGSYREYLDIFSSELLIMEAFEPGTVFISGSDVFTSWIKKGSFYTAPWQYDWGYFDDSDFCFGPCEMNNLQKRREMLFVNGHNYKQVLSLDSLIEGSFFIDEFNDRVFLFPKDGFNPNEEQVEISVRGYDIYDKGRNGSLVRATVYGGKGLVFKGITFEHAANIAHQGCVSVSNTDNLLIENCTFQWNNGVGLELENCSQLTLKNSIMRQNGQRGMGIGSGENMLLEDLKISGNNWRMNADNMISHDAAGIKIFGSTKNVVLKNIHAYDNYCHAVWFDWNNENYRIMNSVLENNQEAGLMLEGSRKPAYVINCIMRNNDIGIKGYGHANVTIDSCNVFANNIQLSLGQDGRIVRQDDDWEINSRNWKIFHSKFLATDKSQKVLSFFEYHNPKVPSSFATTDFFKTVRADFNSYYHPTDKKIFPDGKSLSSTPLSLKEWKKATRQDQNSLFRYQIPE